MSRNRIKQKLSQGEPSIGAWLSLPDRASASIMARLGFDWLLIDMEHTAHNPVLMAEMVAAIASAGNCARFVRVPRNSVEWFKWALDAGAWGVVVPMVNTRAEAESAVEYMKFPLAGTRSIGPNFFASYAFGHSDPVRYLQQANDDTLVILQIESKQGLENVEEILSVPGIDVAFIGPNDLHAQLGLPPSSEGEEPEFVEAVQHIQEIAHRHHIALGIYSTNGEAAARRIRQGFQLISATSDISSLIAGAGMNLWQATEDA